MLAIGPFIISFPNMKNIKTLLLLPVLLLAMGCTSQEGKVTMGNTPEETQTKKQIYPVAQHYLDATGRYDVSDASRYCTRETASGLRAIEKTLMTKMDSSFIAKNTPAKIKITAIELTSDTTAVVSFNKRTPIQNINGTIDMVLRNGQWRAHANIVIPETISKAAASVGDTIHMNYDNIKPGDLKAVTAPKK